MGVEEIIVITDYPVGKKRCIQGQLEGTNPVFFRIFKDLLPGIGRPFAYQRKERLIYPVIVPFGILASDGVTVTFFEKTERFPISNH